MLPEGRPALMGILNITPDSFSDGGLHLDPVLAVAAGRQMVADGADLVDVGGESTRPGAEPVTEAEELRRVVPVVQALCAEGIRVSIDTTKPVVAEACLAAGAVVLNDVTGFQNPELREVCARFGATACIMHMQGEPRTMQANPSYQDVVNEVAAYLGAQAQLVQAAGVRKVWVDLGIGFGKTTAHNLALLRHMGAFTALGYPVLIGLSRKAFLGRILGSEAEPLPTSEREEATLAANLFAAAHGARILRVHNVRGHARALRAWRALTD